MVMDWIAECKSFTLNYGHELEKAKSANSSRIQFNTNIDRVEKVFQSSRANCLTLIFVLMGARRVNPKPLHEAIGQHYILFGIGH